MVNVILSILAILSFVVSINYISLSFFAYKGLGLDDIFSITILLYVNKLLLLIVIIETIGFIGSLIK